MSGYNKETGIFELTASKANYWFRRQVIPLEVWNKNLAPTYIQPDTGKQFKSLQLGMKLYADLFRYYGCEVLKVGPNFLSVKATPEKVWEILSDKKSDSNRASHYYKNSI
jgi:hypothetical protein